MRKTCKKCNGKAGDRYCSPNCGLRKVPYRRVKIEPPAVEVPQPFVKWPRYRCIECLRERMDSPEVRTYCFDCEPGRFPEIDAMLEQHRERKRREKEKRLTQGKQEQLYSRVATERREEFIRNRDTGYVHPTRYICSVPHCRSLYTTICDRCTHLHMDYLKRTGRPYTKECWPAPTATHPELMPTFFKS